MVEGEYGLKLSFHPHIGTAVEREHQIDRLLAETEIDLCFDTGHHAFWNQDPLAYMERIFDRIAYMHLKNVDGTVRQLVLDGKLSIADSYGAGVMCPLPDGVVDIRAVMRLLVRSRLHRPRRGRARRRRQRRGNSAAACRPQPRLHERHRRMTAPIKVGLIGLGEVAQLMHLPLLADDQRFGITAITDVSPSLVDYVATRYSVPIRHPSADALITDPVLDAVFILTPDHLHAELLEKAIRSGKHVFIEKPACLTVDQLLPILNIPMRPGRSSSSATCAASRAPSSS